MKQTYERILALILLCIPGAISVYGVSLLRETVFHWLVIKRVTILPFLWGCFCFLGGLSLVAGFIFWHDKKRKKIQPRLLRNKP